MKQQFSVLKATEGGMNLSWALRSLREMGIKAKRIHSPYVGQWAVEVSGTQRQINKAEKFLLG
jgi:hypothetical protein